MIIFGSSAEIINDFKESI